MVVGRRLLVNQYKMSSLTARYILQGTLSRGLSLEAQV
jgi:hypothetical protein